MEEIPQRFPKGADFLIAHQVLEHTPEPNWNYVAMGIPRSARRVMILSVPHPRYCVNEKARIVPPTRHLIVDYAFNRDGNEFESREHHPFQRISLERCLIWEKGKTAPVREDCARSSPHCGMIVTGTRGTRRGFRDYAPISSLFYRAVKLKCCAWALPIKETWRIKDITSPRSGISWPFSSDTVAPDLILFESEARD